MRWMVGLCLAGVFGVAGMASEGLNVRQSVEKPPAAELGRTVRTSPNRRRWRDEG